MNDRGYFLIIYFCIITGISAQIIPAERRIEWNPGIPNGIPVITSPMKNVIDYGADPTGLRDSKAAFQVAMDALPKEGGIIFFPAGTYRIESTIKIERDNIIIRGEGPAKTKLLIYSNGDCVQVISAENGTWQSFDSEFLNGVNQIIVADPIDFRPGTFAEIQQNNNHDIMYTREEWEQPWSYKSVGQIFEIEEVNGNLVKLKTPMHFEIDSSLMPQVKAKQLIKNVGFENLYIEKMIPKDHTFSFVNSAYCWIKNIESYHTRRSHVKMSTSIGNEVRENYFHASFDYGSGGSGYGVELNRHSTSNLVENNIFDSLRHAMLVQVGANGNVFGYNFSTNTLQGEGETNLNQGWISPDISVHGHYPFMNLFESNYVEEIGIADWWGPVGPGNTYFRNKVNGEGIFYYDHSDKQNVIGNITTAITNSDSTSKDMLEHGNVTNSEVIWDDNIPSRLIPKSLYLHSKPEFFDDLEWPLYGPDIARKNKLPAHIKFEKNINDENKALTNNWISLFDGKSLSGWAAGENKNTWKVVNGAMLTSGPRSHLFYIGDVEDHNFTNFELMLDVKTTPGSNSGIYIHTEYQESGWPSKGYECQVINSAPNTLPGQYVERKMTGSLYAVRNVWKSPVKDNDWFNYRIVVKGKTIQIFINDELMTDYTEPAEIYRRSDKKDRFLSSGTFALQGHDPGSVVYYKNIKVKPLPDDLPTPSIPLKDLQFEQKIVDLSDQNFPLMDLHVHLKGDLTLEQALENSRKYGFTYGIAVNCGLKMGFETDEEINKFLKDYKKLPQTYLAMQAEGREWMEMFSKETINKFDYVFTDAMTWTNDNGKRMRLWIKEETEVGDPENFMDQLVDRIEKIAKYEPIDIYVNATYLPDEIAAQYDELWTRERMDRVILALVNNGVALEINDRYRIPSPDFIKRAKEKGVKFTFGTNNTGSDDLGKLEYCIDMVEECNLAWRDMWIPSEN